MINTPFTSLKILKHPQALNALMRGGIPVPITVEIDPTNLCNFDCIWCMYEGFNKSCPETLPEQFFMALVDELGDMGVKSIVLSGGGEPLMNKSTPSAIRRARAKGLEVALVTNGELINAETVGPIVEDCTWVRISLDAAVSGTYNRCHGIRGRDAFRTTVRNVEELVGYRKRTGSRATIGIGFLVHPYNYHEIFEGCKLARSLGADYIQLRPVYSEGFDLDEKIVRDAATQIQRAKEDFQSDGFVVQSSMERFKPMEREYTRCLACNLVGVVAADMKMYVCCQLKGDPRYVIGDLTKSSFRAIWETPSTHAICAHLDVSQCPPCRYDGSNRILDYLVLPNPAHVDFI